MTGVLPGQASLAESRAAVAAADQRDRDTGAIARALAITLLVECPAILSHDEPARTLYAAMKTRYRVTHGTLSGLQDAHLEMAARDILDEHARAVALLQAGAK